MAQYIHRGTDGCKQGRLASIESFYSFVKEPEMAITFQEALLRKRDVLNMTGWSNSTLYLKIAAGEFKPGVKIGERSVAWPLSEVQAHIAALVAKRDAQLSQEAI
jgi:prophage regulatory protein